MTQSDLHIWMIWLVIWKKSADIGRKTNISEISINYQTHHHLTHETSVPSINTSRPGTVSKESKSLGYTDGLSVSGQHQSDDDVTGKSGILVPLPAITAALTHCWWCQGD